MEWILILAMLDGGETAKGSYSVESECWDYAISAAHGEGVKSAFCLPVLKGGE